MVNPDLQVESLGVSPLSESPVLIGTGVHLAPSTNNLHNDAPRWGDHRFSRFLLLEGATDQMKIDASEEAGSNLLQLDNIESRQFDKIKNSETNIAIALLGWEVAYDKLFGLFNTGKGLSFAGELWDHKLYNLNQAIEGFMWRGIRENEWSNPQLINGTRMQMLNENGYGIIRNLIGNEKFPAQSQLIKFVCNELWLSWIHMTEKGIHVFKNEDASNEFKNKSNLLTPLLRDASILAAKGNRKNVMRTIFEGLLNVEARDEAKEFLFDPRLDTDGRLSLTVEHINVFGLVPTVDALAGKLRDPKLSLNMRNSIHEVYVRIQGEEVIQILADIKEMYDKIDFGKYARNSPEITLEEVGLIEAAVYRVMERKNMTKDEISLVDVAAGTGRHVFELAKRGYRNIVAIDMHDKHVKEMKVFLRKNPLLQKRVRVEQGNWFDVPARWGEKASVRFAIGRSIPHNRTPLEMLKFFDIQKRGLDYEGALVVDLLNIFKGKYKDSFDTLSANLLKIGVNEMQAKLIFDGPNSDLLFNRQTYTRKQVNAMCTILGYKIGKYVARDNIHGENISSESYILEQDENYDPRWISRHTLGRCLKVLGLYDSDVNFNEMIHEWGMTIGQAVLYGLDNESIRILNTKNQGPKVYAKYSGARLDLSSTV
jgi:SAM-dependent methyltransferase